MGIQDELAMLQEQARYSQAGPVKPQLGQGVENELQMLQEQAQYDQGGPIGAAIQRAVAGGGQPPQGMPQEAGQLSPDIMQILAQAIQKALAGGGI